MQPRRNKPKIPHEMAIPSDLIDWITDKNYIVTNKHKKEKVENDNTANKENKVFSPFVYDSKLYALLIGS